MSDLKVSDLKNIIRDYKKKMCPPFSKLNKTGLLKVINDLNIPIDGSKKTTPTAKKTAKPDLIKLMKEFNSKYNKEALKKYDINSKEEIKEKIVNPYFKDLEIIKNLLNKIEDPIEFIKQNKEISSKYQDIEKNFLRRIKQVIKDFKKK